MTGGPAEVAVRTMVLLAPALITSRVAGSSFMSMTNLPRQWS
jgi:hypothetical protein